MSRPTLEIQTCLIQKTVIGHESFKVGEKKDKGVCLGSTFNREGLRSVEQGLVLHGLLVHSQQVELRRTDAA